MNKKPDPSLSLLSRIVIITACYVLGGIAGKEGAFISGKVVLVWPPSGIAVAVICLFGYKYWPGVAAGAVLFSFINGIPPGWQTAGTVVGNTVGAVLCGYLLERFVRFRTNLESVRDVAGFILLASVLGTTVNALFNVTSLAYAGAVDWDDLFQCMLAWWVPNALGALVVAPFLLSWGSPSSVRWTPSLVGEACVCTAGLWIATMLSFNFVLVNGFANYPLAYLPYPFIAWSALRFGQRGATTATLLLGGAAIRTLLQQRGPFVTNSEMNSVILIGTYISILAVTNMLLAAVASERRIAEDGLRESESALAAARDAALGSARMKAEFLANMSHEIRTPMNGIIGMASLLLKSPLNKQQKDFADTIKQSGDLLLTILNDVLDSAKMEAGKLSLESIEFNLRQAIEETLYLFATQAESKGLELICDLERNTPAIVIGDATRLRQIIANLISNGIKFTEKGEIHLRLSHLRTEKEKVWLRVEVRDTGLGIPLEAQKGLFQAFTQADGSTTRRFGGTGLGLAICRQLVGMMGGTIGLNSAPGEGTTFWFELPFLPAPASTGTVWVCPGMFVNSTALIVEENRHTRQVLKNQAEELGILAETAATVEEAVGALEKPDEQYPIRLIMIGWRLESMDGLAFARLLREKGLSANRFIILLTPLDPRLTPEQCAAAHIRATISKPVRQLQLCECLAQIGEGSSKTAERKEAAPSVRAGPRLSILIAEDNQVNQKVTMGQLQWFGYEADVAENGEQAVAAFKRKHYDLILMDCHMPILDGYQAARQIRAMEASLARPSRVHIVAMTADAVHRDREACMEAGMDDFLTKPVEDAQLGAVLRRSNVSTVSKKSGSPAERRAKDGGVDLDRLERITGGDRAALINIIGLYLSQSTELHNLLAKAVENGDAEEIRQVAHKWSGSSSTCGIQDVAALLQGIEEKARNNDLQDVPEIYTRLSGEYARAIESLNEYSASVSARNTV